MICEIWDLLVDEHSIEVSHMTIQCVLATKVCYTLFANNDETPTKRQKEGKTRILCRLLFIISANLFFDAFHRCFTGEAVF